MADLLRIRAAIKSGVIGWKFVDAGMVGYRIHLDQAPTVKIADGDVWQVSLVETKLDEKKHKIAIVRLVAKVAELQSWQKVETLSGHWLERDKLRALLSWLNAGTDAILYGPKGTGKTTLPYKIAEALGWQEPCKVDTYTIKRTTDLFGSDAARNGSTYFVRSALFDYIERAIIAEQQQLETHFLVVLDEINRVHAKSNESMHGLFDDTRQVTIVTTEGSKTIKLPRNIHFIGTMNLGAEYAGIHSLDDALKDRFAGMQLTSMPQDIEVKKLADETKIAESEAYAIIQVSNVLRDLAVAGAISYAPSYRQARNAAKLVLDQVPLKEAIVKGLMGWYQGDLSDSKSEFAKAYTALTMKGVVTKKTDAQESVAA